LKNHSELRKLELDDQEEADKEDEEKERRAKAAAEAGLVARIIKDCQRPFECRSRSATRMSVMGIISSSSSGTPSRGAKSPQGAGCPNLGTLWHTKRLMDIVRATGSRAEERA
jgi:hypothetical protein